MFPLEDQAEHTDILKGAYLKILLKTGKEPITPFSFADEIDAGNFIKRAKDFYADGTNKMYKAFVGVCWASYNGKKING